MPRRAPPASSTMIDQSKCPQPPAPSTMIDQSKHRQPPSGSDRAKSYLKKLQHAPPSSFHLLDPAKARRLHAQSMFIPSPADVAGVIAAIPEGETKTIADLRRVLAQMGNAETACPAATLKYWKWLAYAYEEALEKDARFAVPWWRVLHKGQPARVSQPSPQLPPAHEVVGAGAVGAVLSASAGDIHIGDHARVEGDVFTGGKHIYVSQPSLPALLHTLQSPPPDFTGREKELAYLRKKFLDSGEAHIREAHIAGLCGAGGVGKTALARALCRELAESYPAAQLEIDLQGTSSPLDPYAAMRRLLERFYPGTRLPDEPAALSEVYRGALEENACLLLLDNARSAQQVKPLLPPVPSAAVITSRWDFSLPAQGLHMLRLDVLEAGEAAALLITLLAPSTAPASIEALAKQCGYLPLALRIAAALLQANPDWQIEDLLESLKDECRRLAALKDPDDPDLDVEASLELSYRLLPQDLQAAFRGLGVFGAPFDLAAAQAILTPPHWYTNGEGSGEGSGREALNSLRKHGLLEYRVESGDYSMHDLALLFAQSRLLRQEKEAAATLERAAAYFLAEGAAANDLYKKGGENMIKALQRFRSLWPHLETLWQRLADERSGWPVRSGTDETSQAGEINFAERWLCDLPGRMWEVLDLTLTPLQHMPFIERALAAARTLGDRQAEGVHLGNLGLAHASLGETQRASEFYRQHLEIAIQTGDRTGEGNALGNLGLACTALGEYHQAIEFYRQALLIDRELVASGGDRSREAADLINLGNACFYLGETTQAIEHFQQALAIDRQVGDRRGESVALGCLGGAIHTLGDVQQAIELYEQALVINRQLGDRKNEGLSLGNLGLAYANLGDTPRAIELYRQALLIDRQVGNRRGEGSVLNNLGMLYSSQGNYPQAIELYQQRLEIARQAGDRRGEGNALANMGLAYCELGDRQRTGELWRQALAVYQASEDPRAATVQQWLEEEGLL